MGGAPRRRLGSNTRPIQYGNDTISCYHDHMNAKQRKTLGAIFTQPAPSGIPWTDVERLFRALGAAVSQGSGSRVRVALNGMRAVFHTPHPHRQTDRGTI